MKTLAERWQNGVPHDPRSVALYRAIAQLDFEHGSDRFCFKSGGDGDNGEHLMYLLDMYFESGPALAALVEKIETIVPYVLATIGTGDTFRSERRPDWVEIHDGRRRSSERQLEALLKLARESKIT